VRGLGVRRDARGERSGEMMGESRGETIVRWLWDAVIELA